MKILGIELGAIDPSWKMRSHAWLDMKTLKPSYSVEVRQPSKRQWAHIYTTDKGLKKFGTPEAAQRFIDKIKRASSVASKEETK